MANGKVQCDCSCCQGTEVVTCLSFEEHAKGYMRRPADNIFIVSLNQSIREFCFQGIDNATTSERAAACTGRSAIRRFIQENKSQKVLPMKRRETDVSQQTVLLDLSEQGNDSTQSSQLSASSMPDHQNLPRFPYIHSRQQHHMSSGYQNQQRPSPNQQHWTDVPGSSTLLPSIQYSRADSLLHDSDFFSLQ